MALQITDDNAKELIAGDKLVVIDFWATWCGPCQRMSPIVEELAQEYEGKAVIGKYNVDEGEDLVAEYGIRNIPVLLFLKGGELVHKMVGAAPKAQVAEQIEKFL
jgi:thioredoxin 1